MIKIVQKSLIEYGETIGIILQIKNDIEAIELNHSKDLVPLDNFVMVQYLMTLSKNK